MKFIFLDFDLDSLYGFVTSKVFGFKSWSFLCIVVRSVCSLPFVIEEKFDGFSSDLIVD